MPRNRYTPNIRTAERLQVALQIAELAWIARTLNYTDADVLQVPYIDEEKERHRNRRRNMRRDKVKRAQVRSSK
ncbi:hypothetical protein DD630_05835 [Streptomyces sp. BSE7F]|uniref:hypothetical protein n=1 Tax=Streptomyces sp. BSE7-9 TaxID=2759948 RepID=UPI000D60944A|nr:hypothetical protein [Streptomyces sp. BSE7-9]MBJ6647139.1 hypothetical protein [Streptomyces sp. BSE7-9]PWE06617.1 hypothetical protein DD630_05835 [Streptomyces sp. BSE7F]